MELTHSFTVPGGVEETWSRFQDIAALAECFPGAQVTSVAEDSFEGTVKVKLGPIALVYAGSGTFVSRDDSARTFVVEAKGRDKRGNGTAGATVTLSMTESGDSTDVSVRTDLSITGKPAQFGRGVMQDVSDKLLGQFVACLEQKSSAPSGDASGAPGDAAGGAPGGTPGDAAGDQDAGPASVPTGAAATAAPGEDQDAGPASAPPPEPGPAGGEQSTVSAASTVGGSPPGGTGGGGGEQSTVGSGQMVGGSPPGGVGGGDDALDLGATVLPVLIKSYWKQAAVGAAVVAILIWLIRRR